MALVAKRVVDDKEGGTWLNKFECPPPQKYEVPWRRQNSRSKKGYDQMHTMVSPEVLVQVENTYDPITDKAEMIITEWVHSSGEWLDPQGWKQEELIWYQELPEPRRE